MQGFKVILLIIFQYKPRRQIRTALSYCEKQQPKLGKCRIASHREAGLHSNTKLFIVTSEQIFFVFESLL